MYLTIPRGEKPAMGINIYLYFRPLKSFPTDSPAGSQQGRSLSRSSSARLCTGAGARYHPRGCGSRYEEGMPVLWVRVWCPAADDHLTLEVAEEQFRRKAESGAPFVCRIYFSSHHVHFQGPSAMFPLVSVIIVFTRFRRVPSAHQRCDVLVSPFIASSSGAHSSVLWVRCGRLHHHQLRP